VVVNIYSEEVKPIPLHPATRGSAVGTVVPGPVADWQIKKLAPLLYRIAHERIV
jgi:hypothetical protein